jgi:hypothetical protein
MTRNPIRHAISGITLVVVLASCTTDAPSAPATRDSPSPSAPVPSTQSPIPVGPSLTPVPTIGDSLGDTILATVRAAAPSSVLDLTPDVEPWGVQVDGTVDDGNGPGRLFVVVSSPGVTADNLCRDPDFVQGARCRRVELAGGDVRFERDLVEAKGTRTVTVAIRRVDGSGVLLEAGNFRFDPPAVIVGGQPLPTPEITRTDPVFSLDALADLADEISAATRGCSTATCE